MNTSLSFGTPGYDFFQYPAGLLRDQKGLLLLKTDLFYKRIDSINFRVYSGKKEVQ